MTIELDNYNHRIRKITCNWRIRIALLNRWKDIRIFYVKVCSIIFSATRCLLVFFFTQFSTGSLLRIPLENRSIYIIFREGSIKSTVYFIGYTLELLFYFITSKVILLVLIMLQVDCVHDWISIGLALSNLRQTRMVILRFFCRVLYFWKRNVPLVDILGWYG